MTSWYAEKIKANGINLYYTRTGGDKPPVVLAHGYTPFDEPGGGAGANGEGG